MGVVDIDEESIGADWSETGGDERDVESERLIKRVTTSPTKSKRSHRRRQVCR